MSLLSGLSRFNTEALAVKKLLKEFLYVWPKNFSKECLLKRSFQNDHIYGLIECLIHHHTISQSIASDSQRGETKGSPSRNPLVLPCSPSS